MAGRIAYYGNIVRDGLVLDLDAAKRDSYPGTGTIWRDIAGGIKTGTLVNGPTFDPNNGGSIAFDGTNDYFTILNPQTFSTGQSYTYEVWFNPTTNNTTSGLIGGANNPALRWGQAVAGKVYFFCGYSESPGYIGVLSNSILPVGQWHHAIGSLDSVNKIGKLYINGEFETQFTWVNGNVSVPTSTIYINQRDTSNAYLGKIATGRIYNRALSSSEILQNYNATKGRYL